VLQWKVQSLLAGGGIEKGKGDLDGRMS